MTDTRNNKSTVCFVDYGIKNTVKERFKSYLGLSIDYNVQTWEITCHMSSESESICNV